MWKLLLPFLLLLLAIAAAVLSDRPQPPADVAYVNSDDVKTLDLHRMSWMPDFRVASVLYEGLVRPDLFSRNYDKHPAVAESWTVSEGGLRYEFRLRASARWSNGQPVTARHFKDSWRRAMLPDTAGDYITLFQLIRGARAFGQWREEALARHAAEAPALTSDQRRQAAGALWSATLAKYEELVGVEAPEPRTLVIHLERPVPFFLDLLGFESFAPVYMPLVEAYQSTDPATGRLLLDTGWTRPGVLVSNGPFVLTAWRFKRDMRLDRNPHYWNPASVGVDSIKLPSIADPSAQVLAHKTGAVDVVSNVVPDYKRSMLRAKQAFYAEHAAAYQALKAQGLDPVAIDRRLPPDPRKNIHAFPAFGTYFFNFNCSPTLPDGRPNPLADARVRRALAMVIDKQAIAAIRGAGETPAGSLVPPGSLGSYRPPKGLPRDPEAARALLAAAGHPGGAGLPPIEVLFNKDGGHDLVAQSIAQDWRRELGVEARMVQKDRGPFSDDVKNNRFMVSRAGWFGDYGDPTTFLDLSKTGDGNNDRRFSNPAFDALLARAESETDPEARYRILEEAETMLMEQELPLVPLVHYAMIMLFDPHTVSGVSPHPRQKQSLALLDILGDGKGPDQPLEIPPPAAAAAAAPPSAAPPSAAP